MIRSWFLEWVGQAATEEKVLYCRGLYELWLARNNAKESQRMEGPSNIKDRVLLLCAEWNDLKEVRRGNTTGHATQKWTAPDEGWLKANADGAMAKTMDNSGGGAILRDRHGAFIAGACHFPSPLPIRS